MLKKNNIVTIYADYQTETKQIGVGKLRKRLKKGLPFILEDREVSEQIIYDYEVWYIDFIEHDDDVIPTKPYPIRYIKTVGRESGAEKSEPKMDSLPIDTFIKVNGIEVF